MKIKIPDILTVRWWMWCLRPLKSGRVSSVSYVLDRVYIHYRRHIRRQALRPVCWIKGHNMTVSIGWSGETTWCTRCKKTTFLSWTQYKKLYPTNTK